MAAIHAETARIFLLLLFLHYRLRFLLPLLALPAALGNLACPTSHHSACDGLVYKAGGFTRAQYLPCAGDILNALDRLRPELEATVQGDKSARSKARTEYAEVTRMLKSAGGRNLVGRWEDEELNRLNLPIWNAYGSYGAVLMYPNSTDLDAGKSSHDEARSIYESLR